MSETNRRELPASSNLQVVHNTIAEKKAGRKLPFDDSELHSLEVMRLEYLERYYANLKMLRAKILVEKSKIGKLESKLQNADTSFRCADAMQNCGAKFSKLQEKQLDLTR